MLKPFLDNSIAQLQALLPKIAEMSPQVQRLCDAMKQCWDSGNKVMIAGNGGSAADAMHFAEELAVRFQKNRQALAAMALCDPTVLTCAANDFGYDSVFARQIEALGRKGDLFIGITTSGNSKNILNAFDACRKRGVTTVGFLGKDGGKSGGTLDIEIIIPHSLTSRVQEGHKLLIHTLCEWVDSKYD